jgi:dihydrofolate synthase/folylpolyglutamate synthase
LNHRQALQLLSQRGNEVHGIHLGLHRIAALMDALGHPERGYAVIHIAGTNGKGSVAAMTESILRACGYKTGLYTSPHLERMEERIRVSGRNIAARKFAERAGQVCAVEEHLLANRKIDRLLTYFEFLTACAFLHFSIEKVDVAVIEVGLGGRLDATNVVDPQVCVVTGIALDHQELLGSSIIEIAGEKAGIIKPGVPVISAARPPEAREVIRNQARQQSAPLIEIDRDCRIRVVREVGPFVSIALKTPARTYPRLRIGLAGMHQARNAALAVNTVEALHSFPVPAAAVKRGLSKTRWPGRLDEYFLHRRTLFEGAHNAEGARALKNHLVKCEDCEIHIVFGALSDKDIQSMGSMLFPLARSIHLTPVANPRTASPAEIAQKLSRFRMRMRVHRNALTALEAAWDECPRNGLVLVTGSLYLVGELLPLVRENAER